MLRCPFPAASVSAVHSEIPVTPVHTYSDLSVENNWAKRKLEQIQRGFLLRIVKGYRTISNEAAQILSAIKHLYLTGLMIADVSNVKGGRRVPNYLLI